MNKTLKALSTKLKWQLNDLCLQLQTVEQQLAKITKQSLDNRKRIDNACHIPAIIVPEQEIARLHFIISQQQSLDDLKIEQQHLKSKKESLQLRQKRLNIELKMLEKYQLTQRESKHTAALKTQQNDSDEWILQRRSSQ